MKNSKKIRIIFALLLSMIIISTEAQNITEEVNMRHEDNLAVVFNNRVNLRSAPNLKSKIITKLNMGELVRVEENETIADTINGVANQWYKIKTGHFEGYLWGPLLTRNAVKSKANADVMFLLQNEDNNNKLKLKVVKGELLLAELSFEGLTINQNRNQFYTRGKMGLSNVQDLIYLHYVDYSCGASSGNMIFAWNGTYLNKFATQFDTESNEAFSTQKIVLPSELSGEKNIIHYYTQTGEYLFDEATGAYKVLIKESNHSIYQWTGEEMTQLR